jgi:hypothetical protein
VGQLISGAKMLFLRREKTEVHVMRTLKHTIVVFSALALFSATAMAAPYSIPPEKQNNKKVYFGTATKFEKPAKVDFESVIKATPEYEEVKKDKIEPGTGKYWILLSQASDRANRAISKVGQESGYDFIAAQAYLGGLEPSIPSEDITPLVLDQVKEDTKDKVKGEKVEHKSRIK